jgi:hypothetical protein
MARSNLPPALPADRPSFSQPRGEFLKSSSAAAAANEQGRYPVPVPGKWTEI